VQAELQFLEQSTKMAIAQSSKAAADEVARLEKASAEWMAHSEKLSAEQLASVRQASRARFAAIASQLAPSPARSSTRSPVRGAPLPFSIGDHVQYTPAAAIPIRAKVVRAEDGGKYTLYLPGTGERVVEADQLTPLGQAVEKLAGGGSFAVGDHVEYTPDSQSARGRVVGVGADGEQFTLFLPGKGEAVVHGSQLTRIADPAKLTRIADPAKQSAASEGGSAAGTAAAFSVGDHVELVADGGAPTRAKVVKVGESNRYTVYLPSKLRSLVVDGGLLARVGPVVKSKTAAGGGAVPAAFAVGDHVEHAPSGSGAATRGMVLELGPDNTCALYVPGSGIWQVEAATLTALPLASNMTVCGSATFVAGDHVEYTPGGGGPVARGRVVRAEDGGKYTLYLPGTGERVVEADQLTPFDDPAKHRTSQAPASSPGGLLAQMRAELMATREQVIRIAAGDSSFGTTRHAPHVTYHTSRTRRSETPLACFDAARGIRVWVEASNTWFWESGKAPLLSLRARDLSFADVFACWCLHAGVQL
jgi:hypothetical protein